MPPKVAALQDYVDAADYMGALSFISKHIDLESWKNKATSRPSDVVALRVICLAAEIYDHAGRYGDARDVIRTIGFECSRLLRTISSIDAPPSADRAIWKQRISAVIQLGFSNYREYDYSAALSLFTLANQKLELIRSAGYPCLGSLSRVAHAIGLVHRQRHEYERAKAAFADSENLAADRIKLHPKAQKFYEFSIARSQALGLAWIFYTEGSPKIALPLIVSAKLLLQDKKEQFISAYVDVIHACVLMSWRGDRLDILNQATQLLMGSHKILKDAEHEMYRVRAANELALAFLRKARLEPAERDKHLREADRYVKEVIDFATSPQYEDSRWYCNALIVKSRICRERDDIKNAEVAAQDAVDLSRSKNITFCKIDAAIVLGEVLYKKGDYDLALEYFTDALDTNRRENQKEEAVIRLHLSRCYLRTGHSGLATRSYLKARQAQRGLENAFLKRLDGEVREELLSGHLDFSVRSSEKDLVIDDELRRLRGWFTGWAVARAEREGVKNVVARAVELLGNIGEATFHRWRREADLPAVGFHKVTAQASGSHS